MKNGLRALVTCFVCLLLWQSVVSIWSLPIYLLPSPWRVLQTLYEQNGLIAQQAVPTLLEIIFGYLLGVLFGCCAAIFIAYFRHAGKWFLPLLIVSQAIPTFAIAPLLVIWFGYGMASKIAAAVLIIFFPVTSAFYDGLIKTQAGWLDLAKTMQSSRWRLFFSIRIPAALPALASGLRIAAVAAPVGAIIGEWVGSSRGLGYLMVNANARMQIDLMFAALMVIMLLGLGLYFGVDRILRRVVWWD